MEGNTTTYNMKEKRYMQNGRVIDEEGKTITSNLEGKAIMAISLQKELFQFIVSQTPDPA